MAFDLSKLNILGRLDARGRIFFVVIAVVAIGLVFYLGTRWLASGNEAAKARVANAPANLQSIPGSRTTPEYQRAIEQANAQRAQQAQISGGSAVPTLINEGQQVTTNNQCNIICADQTANVKYKLDDAARQATISPDTATGLEQLANNDVPLSQYAGALDQLVKDSKLPPDLARDVLAQYRKQHADALLQGSAKTMDGMIKAGQLPLGVANQLLSDQKDGMLLAAYAAELRKLVEEGKLTEEAAQQLLAQYARLLAEEAAKDNLALVDQMQHSGALVPDVASGLAGLIKGNAPYDIYATTIQEDLKAGKLAPANATKLLDAYRKQKAVAGPTGTLASLVKAAEDAAYNEISELLKTGQILPAVAAELNKLIQQNVSMADFTAAVNRLVQQSKLTPQIAKLKVADYAKIKTLQAVAQRLAALQANNAGADMYGDELKHDIQMGALTPAEAAQIMREYQALAAPNIEAALAPEGGTAEFAKLQQQVAAGTAQPALSTNEFTAAQQQAEQQAEQDKQARIQALTAAMSTQAQQLVAAWQPPTMKYTAGESEKNKLSNLLGTKEGTETNATTAANAAANAPVLIKIGTILFAVLDTEANSDFPNSPIMATIVSGPFKGARLIGKLVVTTNTASGQEDRISLNFTIMTSESWPRSKSISAYAIDPDTARTVLASSVNYHYLQRFGAIMATSFLQGYGNAILTSGSTTNSGLLVSTTHPELSPVEEVSAGLGQVGQTLGNTTQNYVNIPPTVRVNPGVGLGILFTADVT